MQVHVHVLVLCLFLDNFGLELTRPEFYYYLNQTGVYTVEGTDDAEDYNDLKVMFYRIDRNNRLIVN